MGHLNFGTVAHDSQVAIPSAWLNDPQPTIRTEGDLPPSIAVNAEELAPGTVADPKPTISLRAEGLVLGMAAGISTDAMLTFLSSLLRVSQSCEVVLFVEERPPEELFNTKTLPGLDRVKFEVHKPDNLPSPWNKFHASNARYWLYADYMERSNAAMSYSFVQVSDVRDVAFQADPFANLRTGQEGVHAFLEEPQIRVAEERWNAGWVRDCFGRDQLERIASKTVTCSGYTIGTAAHMKKYLDRMARELSQRASCERNGVDQGVHNVLVHDSTLLEGMKPYILHANQEGWVWTGGYVRKGSLVLDSEDAVCNTEGVRYAVLHQYDRHHDLLKKLQDKYLQAKQSMLEKVLDCSAFDVRNGDIAGGDLTHVPAESQLNCCQACIGEFECQAFVFSLPRRHCWLKRKSMALDERPNDELVIGFRKE